MNRPSCIHIPTLLKGRKARIHWGLVDGAEGYILERRLFGEPEEFPEEFELVSNDGYTEASYIHRGMTWKEIHAAALTCGELTRRRYTWRNISLQGKGVASLHACFEDTIPKEAIIAEYRVKAYNQTGASAWRSSARKAVLDHTPADDDIAIQAVAGDIVRLAVGADAALRFPPSMQVSYDPSLLRLNSITGRYVEPLFLSDGEAEFAFNYEQPEDTLLSAPVALLSFEALISCETQIHMQ